MEYIADEYLTRSLCETISWNQEENLEGLDFRNVEWNNLMQCIRSRKSRKMILFLSCPFQKWTRIWLLPSTSLLSVTLWAAASVPHKSNVCWRFCPLTHLRIWIQTWTMSKSSVWGLCDHSRSWNSLGAHLRRAFIILPSACHLLQKSRESWVNGDFMIVWNTRWEQTRGIKSNQDSNHELLQTDTSFTELSRHTTLNETKYKITVQYILSIILHTYCVTGNIHQQSWQ